MRQEWRRIDDFDGYDVSEDGDVYNSFNEKLLTKTINQQGIPTVALVKDFIDGKQRRRSVPLLVAKAFLPDPPSEHFNTPIHLDGDRSNCRANNLTWRPRWFAIKYHQERCIEPFPNWVRPFEVIETGEIFDHPKPCAIRYGLLEGTDLGIHNAIVNEKFVFPTGFHLRW